MPDPNPHKFVAVQHPVRSMVVPVEVGHAAKSEINFFLRRRHYCHGMTSNRQIKRDQSVRLGGIQKLR